MSVSRAFRTTIAEHGTVWLQIRIADEWAEVRRLERLGLDVRASAHRGAVDRLLDRLVVEHAPTCRCST